MKQDNNNDELKRALLAFIKLALECNIPEMTQTPAEVDVAPPNTSAAAKSPHIRPSRRQTSPSPYASSSSLSMDKQARIHHCSTLVPIFRELIRCGNKKYSQEIAENRSANRGNNG